MNKLNSISNLLHSYTIYLCPDQIPKTGLRGEFSGQINMFSKRWSVSDDLVKTNPLEVALFPLNTSNLYPFEIYVISDKCSIKHFSRDYNICHHAKLRPLCDMVHSHKIPILDMSAMPNSSDRCCYLQATQPMVSAAGWPSYCPVVLGPSMHGP